MGVGKIIGIIALLLLYIVLVVIDLGANLLSFIPVVGTAFETVSELIIELIGGVLVMILAVFGIVGNKK